MTELGPAEAAIFETFVVPRYLALFGEVVVGTFLGASAASVVHLGCRTGYPDHLLAERVESGTLVGLDPSASAIDLARTKAALMPNLTAQYDVLERLPADLPDQAFTHGIVIHPSAALGDRKALLRELHRLVLPRGQVLFALPMRGSFQEVTDLLHEYAIKFEVEGLSDKLDRAAAARPNIEILTQDLADAGFDEVDVDLRPVALEFQSGRDFVEDPISRLLLMPDLSMALGTDDLERPIAYLREAIDRYWSEDVFELTLNIGCGSGRRAE